MTAPTRARVVGPVLASGELARAIAAAIQRENEGVTVLDRGGYLRVSAPPPCTVSRAAIEEQLGAPFSMRRDLEVAMTSFAGRLEIDEEVARWR